MTSEDAQKLLARFRRGQVRAEDVLNAFCAAPFVDLGFAHVDTHRAMRTGFPEVVYAAGKTPQQVAAIARTLAKTERRLLVTRAQPEHARVLKRTLPAAVYHPLARCLTWDPQPQPPPPGYIAVISAGTSDLPVAEEAAITAEIMGNAVHRIHDVGVAGLHRLLAHRAELAAAQVIVVVAGMEGALPSAVAGLVRVPVIAVPTSVGYGASFGGLAALLGMLNSCGSGVTVVNIDNGFGGGFAAGQITALLRNTAPKQNPPTLRRQRRPARLPR